MSNRLVPDESKVIAEAREAQNIFLARGLASLAAARKNGEYVSSEELLRELDEKLASTKLSCKKL